MKYYHLKRHPGIFYYQQHKQRKYGYRLTYSVRHKQHEHARRGFPTLNAALKSEYQVRQRIDTLNSSTGKTVAQWCYEYLHYSVKPLVRGNEHAYSKNRRKISTYKNYYHLLHHYIIPKIGSVKLVQLTLAEYKDLCLRDISMGEHALSLKTLQDINGCFKTVLNAAVQNDEIQRNPLQGYAPQGGKDIPDKKAGLMSKAQLKRFNQGLAHSSLRDRVMFMTLELTGMRTGELLGLSWRDIDFTHGIVHIRHTRDTNGLRVPKTRHSVRDLPVSQDLINVYREYEHYCKGKYHITPKSLVVLSNRGKPITPNLVDRRLRQLLIKFGLSELVGKTTDHEFRHMFASSLINAGYRISDVSKYLGHSNIQTTIKLYVHTLPGKIPNLSNAVKKITK